MIFPYLDIRRGGVIRTQPIIPVTIHGPVGFRQFFALVDSGAEHSLFSLDLITSLRLDTHNANVVEIVGVGGDVSRGYLLDVRLQLQTHQWVGPAVFSDVMRIGSPMILGQAGFFEFFSVAFKRRRWILDIRRAR
ncbi:MAG: retropepsin-like aspartic protease [Pirellulales bacterium]